jgi:predicted O-methyltransferase YrrM
MEVLQIPSELERMLALHAEAKPRRLLEIGCWDGGTLREWLRHAPGRATVVAVDPNHLNHSAYDEWRKPSTRLVVGYGLSQSESMVDLIREHAPYDWVFIDGDHGYGAVRHDVDVCLPLVSPGGLLLLHDITPAEGETVTGPSAVLDELEAAGHPVERIEAGGRLPWSAGIGVVRL